ncbi:MAG: L,D-transpeptidase [Candidatus Woesearchaeota archaeon]
MTDIIKKIILSSMLLFNDTAVKTEEFIDTNLMNTYRLENAHSLESTVLPYTKDMIIAGLSKMYSKNNAEMIISRISELDNKEYSDNEFYRRLRREYALEVIKNNGIESDVFFIDKTFQKAMLFEYDGLAHSIIGEYDCSTALKYGSKIRSGDGKTPEGVFNIQSIEDASDKMWRNDDGTYSKCYGAYFLRFYPSIGIHGNGTDTVKNPDWMNDKYYKNPEPIGMYIENFGYGLSHGCIRLDNAVIRELVECGLLNLQTKIVITENISITKILVDNYSRNNE